MRMFLVNARERKGYSQRRTAKEAGLSHQQYGRIENGVSGSKISFLTIGLIAKVLDISLDEYHRYEKAYIDHLVVEHERTS